MSRYAGRNGRLYMATSGAGSAGPVASLDHFTLDMTTDVIDVTSFGDGNKVYVQGLFDLKGTLSGFWDDTDSTVVTARGSSTPVPMYLYPSTLASTKYAYGVAWVSMTLDVAVKDAAKIAGSFSAGGTWGFFL